MKNIITKVMIVVFVLWLQVINIAFADEQNLPQQNQNKTESNAVNPSQVSNIEQNPLNNKINPNNNIVNNQAEIKPVQIGQESNVTPSNPMLQNSNQVATKVANESDELMDMGTKSKNTQDTKLEHSGNLNTVVTNETKKNPSHTEIKLDDDRVRPLYKAFFEVLRKDKLKSEFRYEIAELLKNNYKTKDKELCTKIESRLTFAAKKSDKALYDGLMKVVSEKCDLEIADNAKESLMPCKVTPQIAPSFVVEKIEKTNNLTKKPGAVAKARGEYLIISGKVIDEQCVPIPNTVITLWQNDSSGYNINDYRINNKWQVKNPDYDKNFAYSGTVQTDNFGNFSFITIVPKPDVNNQNSSSHFNIKVESGKFAKLRTRIYLADNKNNSTDSALIDLQKEINGAELVRRVEAKPTSSNLDIKKYEINLVMQGIAHYRQY